MSIRVTCRCGKQYQLDDSLAGRRAKCAACGRVFRVPRVSQTVTPPGRPAPITARRPTQAATAPTPQAAPAPAVAVMPARATVAWWRRRLKSFASDAWRLWTQLNLWWKIGIVIVAIGTGVAYFHHTDYESRAERILGDPEIFGEQADENLEAFRAFRKLADGLIDEDSEGRMVVSCAVSGGPMSRAVRKHGGPQEIARGAATWGGDIYWYGNIGFAVDGSDSICEIAVRKS